MKNTVRISPLITINVTNQSSEIMEKLIILCLVILVAILLYDRIISSNNADKIKTFSDTNPELPDIMGQPKSLSTLTSQNTNDVKQSNDFNEVNPDDLDIEYDQNETLYKQIPNGDLDKVFNKKPDLIDEEEEFYQQALSEDHNCFAQGVSFEELSEVNNLLQKDHLDQKEKQTTTDIVQRLQGTELFSLLENSIEGASQRIAKLLDNALSPKSSKIQSSSQNGSSDDFNIEEFI